MLILYSTQLLYVNSVLHGETLLNRRLVELLTSTELLYNTSLLKLSLKLLQSALNVLAFFYGYYDHFCY